MANDAVWNRLSEVMVSVATMAKDVETFVRDVQTGFKQRDEVIVELQNRVKALEDNAQIGNSNHTNMATTRSVS